MDKQEFREKMQGIARTRMVKGNPPECGGDWFWLEPVVDDAGTRWLIDHRPDPSEDRWHTIKVYADGRAQRKANFWFGWNGERTNRSRDLGVMEQQRPDLYRLVMDRLREKSAIMEQRHETVC